MNQIDLKGRRAVVTGGAQGIGRAIAERFLASGAKVSLWDRDQALAETTCQELSDAGEVVAVQADLP
ncbi:MAG: SDR family NAD(P)-dependent oxidoreductase, partial [Geminicoccaceae bacterium]